ncbi:hypothetical protein R1flu_006310 [Riccia fluitans]|uniref:Uncharacterized protein n=1 Tax=Riccia fluitans TaxID=41844 RepID=A0ABD1YVN4_9MARC
MKDNVKLRPPWTVASIVRRLVSIPRGGLRQQGIGNFLLAIVAALLIVCIIWGPTVSSSAKYASFVPNVVSYQFLSSSTPEERISSSADAAVTSSQRKDELQALEEQIYDEEEETRIVYHKGDSAPQKKNDLQVEERITKTTGEADDGVQDDMEKLQEEDKDQDLQERTILDVGAEELERVKVSEKGDEIPDLQEGTIPDEDAENVERVKVSEKGDEIVDMQEKTIPDEGEEDGERGKVFQKEEDKNDVEKKTITGESKEEEKKKVKEDISKSVKPVAEKKQQHQLNSDRTWDTAAFRFSPKFTDWDKQRAQYLQKNNASIRAPVSRNSRVMLVSSTSPVPCDRTMGTYLYVLSAKNKVDYARLHDIQFYYDMSILDPNFDGLWNKIALLRMLMVKHPEVDWFWWMDMDAWITDMAFEIPFDKYTSDGKNLFLYGDQKILYDEKSWIGISTGDFGIRNCQWSLNLLDAWASLGIKGIREESGKFLTQNLPGRPEGFPADDQSALAYLLNYEKKKWASKVALELSYILIGHWPSLTAQYEDLLVKYRPGFGDHRWPFCVSFAGCQQCSKVENEFPWETCFNQMLRTYDFADSQVLQTMGFKLVGKFGGGGEVVPLHGKQPKRVDGQPYHIYPNVSDWDQQREAYLKKSKSKKGSKPKVLLVSGSGARECPDVRGTHFLLKSLKNKIDYARMHDMEFYYNMDNLDKELLGWWMKIPIIRAMLLAHPDAEWIWWVDSDAVFTDMIFEPPFESYKDVNLVLWGDEGRVFKERDFISINAGILIVRNCQWSLDFLDSFIPMGPYGQVRDDYGKMLTEYLSERPAIQADDQSAIIYMLNTEKEKWAPKVHFETTFTLSGSWKYITKDFEKLAAEYGPGFGDYRCPLITHFAGCQPCSALGWSNFDVDFCYEQMDRSLHFGDNQVIQAYDLEHQSLNSWELQKLGTFSAAQTNATSASQTSK